MGRPQKTHYIVETGCPGYVVLDMKKNPDYAEVLEKEKKRELKTNNPKVLPRAVLFQTEDMLYDIEIDEKTGRTRKVFRPDVLVVEPGDARGRVYFERGQEMQVRKLLTELRALGRDAKLDESGLLLDEELPEDYVKKGPGRPPKTK